jgi:hypothetical protein
MCVLRVAGKTSNGAAPGLVRRGRLDRACRPISGRPGPSSMVSTAAGHWQRNRLAQHLLAATLSQLDIVALATLPVEILGLTCSAHVQAGAACRHHACVCQTSYKAPLYWLTEMWPDLKGTSIIPDESVKTSMSSLRAFRTASVEFLSGYDRFRVTLLWDSHCNLLRSLTCHHKSVYSVVWHWVIISYPYMPSTSLFLQLISFGNNQHAIIFSLSSLPPFLKPNLGKNGTQNKKPDVSNKHKIKALCE